MTIKFNLPEGIENELRREHADLDKLAKEAFAIEGYRTGRLSLGAVAEILELSTSIQAQEWLTSRGVPSNYDVGELEADRRTLGTAFKSAS